MAHCVVLFLHSADTLIPKQLDIGPQEISVVRGHVQDVHELPDVVSQAEEAVNDSGEERNWELGPPEVNPLE